MLIYIILIILTIIFGMIFEKNNKKLYSIIMIILFTLIAGLRNYTIGNDTQPYFHSFNNFLVYGYDSFSISRFEKGYILLNLIVGIFTDNFTIMLTICALIINIFICNFIRKNSKSMCMSFLLFFFCRFFFSEMNIVRQYIALGIFLYSIKYIENKRMLKYLLYICIAAAFHYSVIFMIPLYYLYDIKLDKKKIIYMSLITLLVNYVFYDILMKLTNVLGIYQGYVTEFYGSNKIGSIIVFFMYFIVYIFLLYITKHKKVMKKDNFLYNCSFILVLVSFLAIKLSVLSRITEYLSILMIVQIPNFIGYIESPKKRLVLYMGVIFCFICYCVVITYFRPNWNNIYPYKFYWQ